MTVSSQYSDEKPRLRGMTWDHPRGSDCIVAASSQYLAERGVLIDWNWRSLYEFGAQPVETFAAEYDIMVIDHPHVGDMATGPQAIPLDELLDGRRLRALSQAFIGSSWNSYMLDGHIWAIPIDAASQVCAWREDMLNERPSTWTDVQDLAEDHRVLLPLSPTDAYATFCTMVVSLGGSIAVSRETFVSVADAEPAVELMRRLMADLSPACLAMTPIQALELLSSGDGETYCPLLYGYSNYSRRGFRGRRIRFGDPVPVSPQGCQGTMLGGAGLAISAGCTNPEAAVDFVCWISSPEVQAGAYFDGGGQPASVSAWSNPALDALVNGFFSGTRSTQENSWTRPTHRGYVAFQTAAFSIVHEALLQKSSARQLADRLNEAYRPE